MIIKLATEVIYFHLVNIWEDLLHEHHGSQNTIYVYKETIDLKTLEHIRTNHKDRHIVQLVS